MRLKVFAAFKDYFAEDFQIEHPIKDLPGLKIALLKLNPEAKELLDSARFAINHEFIDDNYLLSDHEYIFIIPPSGGG